MSTENKLSKAEAKQITIDVWEYLAEHPEIRSKLRVPDNMFRKIVGLYFNCPFCEIYRPNDKLIPGGFIGLDLKSAPDFYRGCPGCPLSVSGHHCNKRDSYYAIWSAAFDGYSNQERSAAAQGIADTARAWNIEGETNG